MENRHGDEAEDRAPTPEPPELVEVSVRIPARVLSAYDAEVSDGLYIDRDEALRQGLIEAHRFHRGRYSTLRIEFRNPEDRRRDTEPQPPVEDLLAARDAFRDADPGPDAQDPDGKEPDERA